MSMDADDLLAMQAAMNGLGTLYGSIVDLGVIEFKKCTAAGMSQETAGQIAFEVIKSGLALMLLAQAQTTPDD